MYEPIYCICRRIPAVFSQIPHGNFIMTKKWDKQNPSKARFLFKGANAIAKIYKPKYITFKTKIHNNKPRITNEYQLVLLKLAQ